MYKECHELVVLHNALVRGADIKLIFDNEACIQRLLGSKYNKEYPTNIKLRLAAKHVVFRRNDVDRLCLGSVTDRKHIKLLCAKSVGLGDWCFAFQFSQYAVISWPKCFEQVCSVQAT